MDNEQDAQEQQKNDNNKVEKKFQLNFAKLLSLLQGDTSAFSNKVPNTSINEVMKELLADKTKATIETFKKKALNLLDRKVEFDKSCAEEKKKFDSAILAKKKDFTKEMEDCFGMIENMNKLHAEYMKSLSSVVTDNDISEDILPAD